MSDLPEQLKYSVLLSGWDASPLHQRCCLADRIIYDILGSRFLFKHSPLNILDVHIGGYRCFSTCYAFWFMVVNEWTSRSYLMVV